MNDITPPPAASSDKLIDVSYIIERAKLVLTDPKGCWNTIKAETHEPIEIVKKYALPLIVASQVAAFIKATVIGTHMPLVGLWRAHPVSSLVYGALLVVLMTAMLFISAIVFEKLAPKFGGSARLQDTFKLMAYSNTAGWLAGILIVVPILGTLAALAGAIYGLYTLYHGITPMTGVPSERRIGYLVVSILVMAVIAIVLFGVVGGLFAPEPPMNPDLQRIQENLQRMIPGAN